MKHFIRDIFIFTTCLILINMGLYAVADKLYFAAYQQYSTHYAKYLFADSHGLSLNNHTNQYGVYNFSAGSESYIDIKRKLRFLINHTDVDTIYLTADDHTLSQYREKANNTDRSLFYISKNEYDHPVPYYLDRLKSKLVLLQPQTRSVIRYYLFYKISRLFTSDHAETAWHQLPTSEKIAKSKDRFYSHFNDYNLSTELKMNLLEIIKLCQINDIELIGIKFPLSREYLQVLGNTTFGAVDLLEKEGCTVLDFKNLFVDHPEYFENEDHLNATGGRALARKMFSLH